MARRATQRKIDKKDKPAGDPGGPLIVVRAHGFNRKLTGMQPDVEKLAREWSYILRVRTRWSGDSDMREHFRTRAVNDLGKIGLTEDDLQKLTSAAHISVELDEKKAPAAHIEVELSGWTEQALREAETFRMFEAAAQIPWEYLLSAATLSVGRFQPLLVTRCIRNRTPIPIRPRTMLFVESAPGRIRDEYEFDDEEARIEAAAAKLDPTYWRTEPLEKLVEQVERDWDIIHVTGIDNHQAAWLIPGFYDAFQDKTPKLRAIDESDCLQDGMILRGAGQSEWPVRHDELVKLLLGKTGGLVDDTGKPLDDTRGRPTKKPPAVVTLNFYYSGARVSRELVRGGAGAALGFLDEIDDEFAELFFQAFYWAWCHRRKPVPDAFLEAWSKMDSDRMHGTSIVIWLGQSMVEQLEKKSTRKISKRRRGDR